MTKTMFSKATVKSKCPRQPRTTGPNESSLRQRSGIAIAALGMIDQAEVAARLEGGRGAKTMLNLLSKIVNHRNVCRRVFDHLFKPTIVDSIVPVS